MRVLQVNKFLYPVGGSEAVLFRTADLLERHGHDVSFFGMRDSRNAVPGSPEAFVSNVELRNGGGLRESLRRGALATAGRFLYSREAAEKMEALIREAKPDVAHLHNIYHQLSPSILTPLRRHGVPVVLTLHDYKLICPNYTMHSGGAICERCKGHRYYQPVIQSCVKSSRLKSALCAIEACVHTATGAYSRGIDTYIAPSRFMADKVIEFGFDGRRVVQIPNFIDVEDYEPSYDEESYFAYVGRVETVKGVSTLVRAVSSSEVARGFELRIAGDGDARQALEQQCRDEAASNVRFLGRLDPADVGELVRKAMFLVLPSEWYENAPVSVLEAYAYGKPVVAARIGGLPELVVDGETGLLFEPGNAEDLRNKIEYLLSNPGLTKKMGKKARARAESTYGAAEHYRQLLATYERAAAAHGRDLIHVSKPEGERLP